MHRSASSPGRKRSPEEEETSLSSPEMSQTKNTGSGVRKFAERQLCGAGLPILRNGGRSMTLCDENPGRNVVEGGAVSNRVVLVVSAITRSLAPLNFRVNIALPRFRRNSPTVRSF
jgi:hypothetical protein